MPIFTSDLTSRGIIYADTILTNSNENLTLNPSGTGVVSVPATLAVTGVQTITNTSLDDSFLLTTTEDSATAGPVITLKRNSTSPADGDYIGQIKFKGENDADQEIVYAKITGKILDNTDGTEDGILEFSFIKNGSQNISGRFRSDSLQLLNDTNLTVSGTTTLTGALSLASDVTVNGTTFTDRIMSTGSNNNIQLTPNGTGLVDISGDLSVNLIKSSDSTNIRIEDNLVPAADDTYSLGSPDRKWSALYVTGQTIFLNTTKLQVDGSGDFTVKDSSNNLKKVKAAEVEIGSGANKIRIKRRSNGRVQFTDENDEETPVLQIVGDDSTGVSLNSNETIKIQGGVGIQTAVTGDTLLITGSTAGFTNSTITQFPFTEDSSPTDFSDDEPAGVGTAASGQDAFGVAISSTFDCMEPTGSVITEDFGASESHVGA